MAITATDVSVYPPDNILTNSDRILTVDVLRGWALFGIFYAHMVFWYAGGPLPEELYQAYKGIGSGVAVGLYIVFILGKFFAIFSFLFGLSFYLQMQSLAKRHRNFVGRFAWRLCILGVIGLIHHAVWRADILTIYVPLGFLLIFARDLSNKTLLIIGLILVFNIPTKLAELGSILLRGEVELIKTDNITAGAEYLQIMKHASFAEMTGYNMGVMTDKLIYQINSGRLLITFGFFLLGMLAGRLKYFVATADKAPAFKAWWKKLLWIIIACAIVAVLGAVGAQMAGVNGKPSPWMMWSGSLLWELLTVSLTLFYIVSITLLMLKPRWQKRFAPFGLIGKMALTIYLMQTVIGLYLFSGLGFGLIADTSPGMNAVMCVGFFILQIIFCYTWLRYFQYGPVEWLWRSATDLKWQRLTRKSSSVDFSAL
jgi:uncharacterized protein